MVHGDDFSALGNDTGLDLWEKGMAKAFEVKLKGRLGPEKHDCKELRVLNRILRMTDKGVAWEADPRHAEHVVRALELTQCRFVSTPCSKMPFDTEAFEKPQSTVNEVISSVVLRKPSSRPIRFCNDVTVHEIKPYSEVFGLHPRRIVIVSDAHDTLSFVRVPIGYDAFTGRSMSKMDHRRKRRTSPGGDRHAILRSALEDGAAWQIPTISLINAVSKQTKVCPKASGRQGREVN